MEFNDEASNTYGEDVKNFLSKHKLLKKHQQFLLDEALRSGKTDMDQKSNRNSPTVDAAESDSRGKKTETHSEARQTVL